MLDLPNFDQIDGQIVSGFVSKHAAGDFREWNPGIGYRTKNGLAFGFYINSLGHKSAYIVQEVEMAKPHERVTLVAGLGLVTGYRYAVMPMAYPAAVISVSGPWSLALGAVPGIKDRVTATAWAQVRYSLK